MPKSTRPTHSRDQRRWADDVAGRDRLRETITSRDRDRLLQIDHWPQTASTLIRRTADGSCPRLRSPRSNAGLRTPEIRPRQQGDPVARNHQRRKSIISAIRAPTPMTTNIAPSSVRCTRCCGMSAGTRFSCVARSKAAAHSGCAVARQCVTARRSRQAAAGHAWQSPATCQ